METTALGKRISLPRLSGSENRPVPGARQTPAAHGTEDGWHITAARILQLCASIFCPMGLPRARILFTSRSPIAMSATVIPNLKQRRLSLGIKVHSRKTDVQF